MATTITPLAMEENPDADAQKKILRAQRFGISPLLSEQDKRNSRAQRFGIAPTILSSDEFKLEEQKRKARAERNVKLIMLAFTCADEDAKKQARLARFAPLSKIDPLEEDKRKARALRFSNHSSAIAEVGPELQPLP